MKTIMIVDEEPELITQLQSFASEENIMVIHAKNQRQAVTTLNDKPDVSLILVRTTHPKTNNPACFSIKPSATFRINTEEPTKYLQTPFTTDQLTAFIKEKL